MIIKNQVDSLTNDNNNLNIKLKSSEGNINQYKKQLEDTKILNDLDNKNNELNQN